jgi:DNA repair exonuclease SbcCD ATPase subunit
MCTLTICGSRNCYLRFRHSPVKLVRSSRLLRCFFVGTAVALCLSIPLLNAQETTTPNAAVSAVSGQASTNQPAAALPAETVASPDDSTAYKTPRSETITAAITALSENTELEASSRQLLIEQYRQAQRNLEQAKQFDSQSATIKERIKDAPTRLTALDESLRQLSGINAAPVSLPEGITKESDLDALRNALTTETARLDGYKTELGEFTNRLEELQSRPDETAKRKLDAEKSLQESGTSIKAETAETLASEEAKARLT